MSKFLTQFALTLEALSMLIPLLPDHSRPIAAQIFQALRGALSLAGEAGADFESLAAKLRALRAEIEAMVAAGVPATVEAIEDAFARVAAASAAFRAAAS